MPKNTDKAISWAKKQEVDGVKIEDIYQEFPFFLVEKAREFFEKNNIEYETFDYEDLKSYL